MAEERVRADVLADPNVRAVMDAFPDAELEILLRREAADMPEMPDLDEIMKMAQNAQAELQKAQDNLDKIEVEGAAGGGLVKIRATAKGRILGVDIDESLLAAVAKRRWSRTWSRRRSTTPAPRPTRQLPRKCRRCRAALPLPPGFKLPF